MISWRLPCNTLFGKVLFENSFLRCNKLRSRKCKPIFVLKKEVVIDVVYWLTIFSSIFHNSMQICSAYGVERSKDKKGFISFMNVYSQ
ncbi:unnamed protein product, partial [Vitis vinifera]|uniref:Uncharacterized protein n=1 Tax=Vitis vinifera TaxID=29760 RepID=D7TF35_VITVI